MVPVSLKIGYTLFVCALVPIYWRQYGPANILWFSDIALLALVPALWMESALIASMMAVAVVFFEAIWNIDFFFRLVIGKSLIGLSAYMFDPKIPLFHPQPIVFPHRPAADTSLDRASPGLRSTGVSLADNCRTHGPTALLSDEQRTGECELGLWLRPKTADDSAWATVRDSFNGAVPARCLSADASSFRPNLSSSRHVKGAFSSEKVLLKFRAKNGSRRSDDSRGRLRAERFALPPAVRLFPARAREC